jgi:hypothetical protein
MGATKTWDEKLWNRLNKNGPICEALGTKCWVWMGGCSWIGYGLIQYNGHTTSPHRLAYIFTHGDLPAGIDVLHKCDNRKCCNPDHLFEGTQLDNIKDMFAKGRNKIMIPGHLSPRAVLTKEQVFEILSLKGQMSYPKIAKKVGCTKGSVTGVLCVGRYKPYIAEWQAAHV